MHYLRLIVLWQNNGNNKRIGSRLLSQMLKMIATTSDNLPNINGNNTAELLFLSK